MSTIPLDLELCIIPKETEEKETEDSNEEDEHIDDTPLIKWMENQFESEDEMSYEFENRHPNRQDGFPVSSVFKFRRIGTDF